MLDGVRQLDADNGVGRQLHTLQPSGDRAHHAVGLCKGQGAPRRAVGECFPVGRVGQRQRLGPPRRDTAEYLVDRDPALAVDRWGRSFGGLAQNHCRVPDG